MGNARHFVGLDLGQSNDPSAIAILERAELKGDWDAVAYAHRKKIALRLRHLERIPLGTPYPEVVHRVWQITRSAELRGRCTLVVDATGVGRPVVDLLRKAGLECSIIPVVITGAQGETSADGYYRVPKRDLIVGLQLLLEAGALEIAAEMEYGDALTAELTAIQVKQTAAGHEQYGALKEGEHDDLVMALALAHWWAKKAHAKLDGEDGYWQRDPDPCEEMQRTKEWRGLGTIGERQTRLLW